MRDSPYYKQVELLLRCLPEVNKEGCFSLKGGTAINLFVRDLPRLSVDIDLAFLPLDPWEAATEQVEASLQRISTNIKKSIKNVKINESKNATTKKVEKLFVSQQNAMIKIEPNPVIRGSVYKDQKMDLVKAASDIFQMEVSTNVLSIADLYGGKLVAALDRQHPRDLFDTKLLLEDEGITVEIRKAFLVYLASHARPMHEIIIPTLHNKKDEFEKEFVGMTNITFSYGDFESTRTSLIKILTEQMTKEEKLFLLSIQDGTPEWDKLEIPNLDSLPALKWKVQNVQKMEKGKREHATKQLKSKLGI